MLLNLRDFICSLPKIDLHRHLEGSFRLSTLCDIAHQHEVNLPSPILKELRRHVQVVDDPPDFLTYLAKFKLLRRFFTSREVVERVTFEALTDAAADNVRYLELRISPAALALNQGYKFEDVVDWVLLTVDRAQREHEIQVRLIILINRQEPQYAHQLAEIAADKKDRGVVGIDLAGDEINYSELDNFVEVFQWAKRQGLHITVHAAEAGPALNAKEAIEKLGAERIGHGMRVREDSLVMDLLKKRQITLEVCPTSNIHTGLVPELALHPLHNFHKIGIPVTINTDNPSISNITLSDEYQVVTRSVGVPFRVLPEIILNAAKAAFLPEPEKGKLVTWFQGALTECMKQFPEINSAEFEMKSSPTQF